MGARADELVRFVGNRAFLRVVDGMCAALRVDRERGTFPCSAYDVRPAVCRDLARGSPECLGEIATKGDRPHRMLQRR